MQNNVENYVFNITELPRKVNGRFYDPRSGMQHISFETLTPSYINPNDVIIGIKTRTGIMKQIDDSKNMEPQNQMPQNNPKEKEDKKRLRKLLAIPVAIGLLGTSLLVYNYFENNNRPKPPPNDEHTEEKEEAETIETQKVVSCTIPIDMEVYDVDNPSLDLAGNVGMLGQERMTNQYIFKDSNAYNQDNHADAENTAVGDYKAFDALSKQQEDYFAVMGNPSATKEEKLNAIDMIISLQGQMNQIYSKNSKFMEHSRRCV